MQIESCRDYHMRRARVELDFAYRAEGWAAMEAHLKLSALHMARLRNWGEIDRGEAPAPNQRVEAGEMAIDLVH